MMIKRLVVNKYCTVSTLFLYGLFFFSRLRTDQDAKKTTMAEKHGLDNRGTHKKNNNKKTFGNLKLLIKEVYSAKSDKIRVFSLSRFSILPFFK